MKSASFAKYSLYGVEALDERRALIASLVQRGCDLAPTEVRQLRRALFEDDGVSRDEAQALFDLERAQGAPCAEWTEFFVECLTDHVVWQCRPTGIIGGNEADWLIREADRCRLLTGVALLANVLAEAHRTPVWMASAVHARAQAPEVQAAIAREA
ncbi:MAG TPA: hypothetical protein VMU18_01970 [Rhodoblastus sp.]|nr:hypothetical protein [Rhodoblastus sp.]